MGKKKQVSSSSTEEIDTDTTSSSTTTVQQNDAKPTSTPRSSSTVTTSRRSTGPSLFSTYFLVPCALMTVTKLYANYWWKGEYYTLQRNEVNDQFGGSVSLTDPFFKEHQMIMEAYSSLVYFVAILYMARGSVLKGFFFGLILASVMNFTWLSTSVMYLRYNPGAMREVFVVDFVWQVCSSAIMAQFAVFIAAFFTPSKPSLKSKSE